MTCPGCSREVAGEFAFCPHCGTALAAGGQAPGREERKVVTVLFADLAGFTARAEALDPEDVRALLAPYHAHLRAELERFGGTVEKFIGDAVMALFGAPVAREDDPERGVRAALAIRDWAREQGDGLQVRVAVNTGEALVSLDARPVEGESMAAGDVVNTTARLQTAAPLNGVLVGEQTYRATAHAIEYRQAEPVSAKGKREPVAAWEALEARSRLGVDLAQRSAAPLVGRGRELDLLASTLGRVRDEESPQLVTLVGVPGIGKSRLVAELFRTLDEDVGLVRWRQGRSLPYGEGVTFWALAEIVKAEAGILESDTPAQSEAKLAATVAGLGLDAAESQWLERRLRPLAGGTETGADSQEEAFAAWRRFLEALAQERPLVLVFEDLHWADDVLLDFVDLLVERAAPVPLLVIATARPELLQRRPGWGGGKPNALTISLAPLSDGDTASLLEALLPAQDESLRAALRARAGGNPLYAEQYARALLERGEVGELPETVQGIIAARLDALAEPEKRLLQDAAVVGKVFWLGAVEAVDGVTRWQAEELLFSLERKEFVKRARTSSVASETEYAFRHVLIRDVAYGQIPRAARSQKHARAAGWIESLGRAGEQAELIAHHYLQALELAEAAGIDPGALRAAARGALRAAGERAGALYAADAAVGFYEAALRLAPDAAERADLLYRRAVPIGRHVGGGDIAHLEEALPALLAAGDRGRAAEVEMHVAQSYWILGRQDDSEARAARAVALLDGAPPSGSTAWVLAREATRASLAGEHGRATEIATSALRVSEELGWSEGLSEASSLLGMERLYAGDPSWLEQLRRGVELAAASGSLGVLARANNSLAVGYQLTGDLDSAYACRLAAAETIERLASPALLRWSNGVLSDHAYRRGDWDGALRAADAFVAEVEAGSPNVVAYQVYVVRSLIRLARGDDGGAVADVERAAAVARSVQEIQAVQYVAAAAAHVLAVAAGPDRARPFLDEVLDSVRAGVDMQFGVINLPLLASAAVGLGAGDELVEAFRGHRRSRWTDAAAAYVAGDFEAAAALLAEAGERPAEAEARLRGAERLAAAGRHAEAGAQLRAAAAFFRSVGATRYLADCGAVPAG